MCTKIIYRLWQCYQILNLINDFFIIVEQNAIISDYLPLLSTKSQ